MTGIIPSSGSPPVCGLTGGAGSWVTLLIFFCEHTYEKQHVISEAYIVCTKLTTHPL